MKTFSTSGTGSQQSLSEIENNKIPVYDTKTDAESDLANLTVGQIIATKDEGNETSTPVDVVEDGNMHAVTSNAVANSLSYSTAEILTGETWIDGKPIYRKVIDCGAMPNNTTKNVAHGISNIGKVVRSEGYSDNNAGIQIPVPYVSDIPLSIFVDNTNIVIQTSGDYTAYVNTYITLEYTKTTD